MALSCVAVSGAYAEKLVAILHDAEEDDERIRATRRGDRMTADVLVLLVTGSTPSASTNAVADSASTTLEPTTSEP